MEQLLRWTKGITGSARGWGYLPAIALSLGLLTVLALLLLLRAHSAEGGGGVPSASISVPALIPGMPVCTPSAPPNSAGVPADPAATPVPAPPVFGLAWFHKPPEDGTSALEIARQNSYIHLTGPSDAEFLSKLRAEGYTRPVYTYVTASAVEGPGPYKDASSPCRAGYTPYDNNLASEKDDFCRFIHPHESWFLHNGQGTRLVGDYFGSGRWTYMMNPADQGWQAFAQDRLLSIRDNQRYNGVWLDNVDLDLNRARTDLQNSDGQVQEFSTDGRMRAAMQQWLAGVHTRLGDWPVWANLVGGDLTQDGWDAYAPYLDGAMDESFAVRWVDGRRSPAEWEGQLARADRWLSQGKGLVMVGQGAEKDTERMRFTLASYLLVAQGSEAFYRYTRFDSYYNSFWFYPEFDTARALGAPTGPRTEVAPGLWQRSFEHGTVQVDLAGQEGKLTPAR